MTVGSPTVSCQETLAFSFWTLLWTTKWFQPVWNKYIVKLSQILSSFSSRGNIKKSLKPPSRLLLKCEFTFIRKGIQCLISNGGWFPVPKGLYFLTLTIKINQIYLTYCPRLPTTLWGGIWTPQTYLKQRTLGGFWKTMVIYQNMDPIIWKDFSKGQKGHAKKTEKCQGFSETCQYTNEKQKKACSRPKGSMENGIFTYMNSWIFMGHM